MKMNYIIVGQRSAGGYFGRVRHAFEDADGKVIIFQTYEEATQRCEKMNAKLVDRNFRYSVERQLTHYFGKPLPTPQDGPTKPSDTASR
jgi:hypothetical protein